MGYELTDGEWTAIKSMLPNKPRGVPRERASCHGLALLREHRCLRIEALRDPLAGWHLERAIALRCQGWSWSDDKSYRRRVRCVSIARD